MGDPSKFSSIIEYYIAFYAIAILVLSELAIWLFSSRGRGKEKRKSADSGTVWLIIIGWCWGVIAGAFFRSQSVPDFIRDVYKRQALNCGILDVIELEQDEINESNQC